MKRRSRLDAATALHLRKEVEKGLERHTPGPRYFRQSQAGMDYQRRIPDYAFSAQGDIIVIEHKLKMSEIEQFNQEAEKIASEGKQSALAQKLSQSQQQRRRFR